MWTGRPARSGSDGFAGLLSLRERCHSFRASRHRGNCGGCGEGREFRERRCAGAAKRQKTPVVQRGQQAEPKPGDSVEFRPDIGEVKLHRSRRYVQMGRDLLIRRSAVQCGENLLLHGGEPTVRQRCETGGVRAFTRFGADRTGTDEALNRHDPPRALVREPHEFSTRGRKFWLRITAWSAWEGGSGRFVQGDEISEAVSFSRFLSCFFARSSVSEFLSICRFW